MYVQLTDGAPDDLAAACMRGDVVLGTRRLTCSAADGFEVTSDSSLRLKGTACDAFRTGDTLVTSFPCDVVGSP